MMSNNWTERRKADRAKMAKELAARLRDAGATVEVEREGSSFLFPRRILLRISATHGTRAATMWVDFDGDTHQPDVHVATWNTEGRACFSDAMGAGRHMLNRVHFGKASRVCEGFEALASDLVCDVMRITSGEAFSVEREEKKRAEYAAKGWTW